MTGVVVFRCAHCSRRSFPRRELCPYCAGRDFTGERVDRGTATAVTTHRGVGLACVQIDRDVSLLARAAGAIVVGAEVALHVDDGAPVATGG